MQYKKTFTIGKDENKRLNNFVMRKSRVKNSFAIAVLVIFAEIMINFFILRSTSIPLGIAFAVLFAAIAVGLFWLICFVTLNIKVKVLYERELLKPFLQKIRINSEGIHTTTDEGAALRPFDDVVKVCESSKDIYIFVSETQAFVIPKSQMKNPETDRDELCNVLRNYLPPEKLFLRKGKK